MALPLSASSRRSMPCSLMRSWSQARSSLSVIESILPGGRAGAAARDCGPDRLSGGPWRLRSWGCPSSPAPAPAPSAAATNEPDEQQQNQSADRGVDDRRNDTGAEMDAEPRKDPAADESADDPDQEIADDAEPGALHDLACQPSGNEADQQDDQEAFTGHVHRRFLAFLGLSNDSGLIRHRLARLFRMIPAIGVRIRARRSALSNAET